MTHNERSEDEIQREKYELWDGDLDAAMLASSPKSRLVAEGDSWFDYPPDLDILDQLKKRHHYAIEQFAQYGSGDRLRRHERTRSCQTR